MKRNHKVECNNCGWTGKRKSSALEKSCPKCGYHYPKKLMAKDRKIEVEVVGCPWCDQYPSFASVSPGVSVVEAQCRNVSCKAKPTVFGDSLTDCVKIWNSWSVKNDPKNSKGPTMYTVELTRNNW